MRIDEVKNRLSSALSRLVRADLYLLERDLGERCIAARVALHLQPLFKTHAVDVEYNRLGLDPKRLLGLPFECARYRNEFDESLAVPDLIVHRRGRPGPHLLVVEFKKTSDRRGPGCDRLRLCAFREQVGYDYGALVLLETRKRHAPGVVNVEWFHGADQ